ncbi:hypothetical protein V6N12_034668 [Hibiscus sabdariffa]|uniref:Uncharacterized protein n=1 Tax=Hibiscus sabdariffa TaxID=183260 RepID=A0ABR2B8E8_9ROSI
MDSLEVVGIVRQGSAGFHRLHGHFKDFWSRPWTIQVTHVANACAKLASFTSLVTIFFQDPPPSVIHLLHLDGSSSIRGLGVIFHVLL